MSHFVLLQLLVVGGTRVEGIVLEIVFLHIMEEDGALQNRTFLLLPMSSWAGRMEMMRRKRAMESRKLNKLKEVKAAADDDGDKEL